MNQSATFKKDINVTLKGIYKNPWYISTVNAGKGKQNRTTLDLQKIKNNREKL